MEIFWFAARTIANTELNMRDYLRNHRIECFVPTIIHPGKKHQETPSREILLVTNLIFFKTDFTTANTLFSLKRQKIFCIRNQKGLITVPEKQMNDFMAFVKHYGSKIVFGNDTWIVGEKARIKSGPFAGMEGVVNQVDNKNYFTLSLGELLSLTVKFPKSNLTKIAVYDGI